MITEEADRRLKGTCVAILQGLHQDIKDLLQLDPDQVPWVLVSRLADLADDVDNTLNPKEE